MVAPTCGSTRVLALFSTAGQGCQEGPIAYACTGTWGAPSVAPWAEPQLWAPPISPSYPLPCDSDREMPKVDGNNTECCYDKGEGGT